MTIRGPTFAAIDFETANHDSESACAIGVAIVRNGMIEQSFQRLIRPPSPSFSDWNYRIHGIHWTHVQHEPDFAAVWASILPQLDGVQYLAAHNAGFDEGVLKTCCEQYGINPPPQRFVCTIEAASAVWSVDSYRLARLCQFLGIPLNHHQAQSDAAACAGILLRALHQGYSPGVRNSVSAWAAKHLCSQIMGLVADIMRDGIVERSEILAMAAWLKQNPDACNNWPGSQFSMLVDSILRDGVIDDHELEEFRELCCMLLGLQNRVKASRRAAKKPGAKSVCFTGFGRPSRKQELREEAEAAGFHVTSTVTKKLDFLVCGPDPGPSKLKLAEERGSRCIGEQEWRVMLAEAAAQ